MKIVFVSSEVSPYSKTGGLADVAESLPKEFLKMGHEVLVITPKYREIRIGLEYVTDYSIEMYHKNITAVIRKHVQHIDGKELNTYFVDSAYYFDRNGMYCHPDEAERFAFFDKAACKIIEDFNPDVVHLNDWQSGPIAVLLRDVYKNYTSKIVYTIHNMEYNGKFDSGNIIHLGLDPAIYFTPNKLEFFGEFSFSKAGILYADVVTTVSNTYAQEIQTQDYGFGYEGLLRFKKDQNRLFGIVNGIDYEKHNPETSNLIFKNYNADTVEDKRINKEKLQEQLGLPIRDVPMLAIVSRVVSHKGFDILIESLKDILQEDVQFVQLGIGDNHYINRLNMLKERFPNKVSVNDIFDTELAEKIYAAADIFLMPSLFEPCGLSQLISFRYGTIPVARKTGGLNDTVVGYLGNKEKGNGFTFFNNRSEDLTEVTNLALETYKDKEAWRALQQRVMRLDFSWKKSAEEYINLYNKI